MLIQRGFELFGQVLDESHGDAIREKLFRLGNAGTRCLLDDPSVREIVTMVRETLVKAGRLPVTAVAIQAIAFNKTPDANWKVTWHQDVMFPFARRVSAEGYMLPSKKEEVNYARPPRHVMEVLLAVRIHLDDCDETNGPLRVSPGTHQREILRSTEIADCVARHGDTVCLARAGEALLMKPLLLHASSRHGAEASTCASSRLSFRRHRS